MGEPWRVTVPSLVLAALPACTRSVSAPQDKRLELREQARSILLKHCGECHDPKLKTAVPDALKIFNLGESDWAHRMTDRQLQNAAWRLTEDLVPTRGSDEARPLHVPAEERRLFDNFVTAEQAARR